MVKNLPPGGAFYFRVKAENPAGLSAPAEMSLPVELKTKKGGLMFQALWL
jgi:hypothetical protein